MKKLRVFLFIAVLFTTNGCGLLSSLTDVTTTANQLLGSIDDIVRQIDASVQNGDLSREVGDLIDERLDKLASILEETIQNSGGFLFDQANGTINNIFGNISALLDQIKTGILDESLPALVQQLSTELQLQINLLSSNIEDIIVLTFGNTFILLDKTTNSAVIIASISFLAIGLFVFALVLFSRKSRSFNLARILGLSFMIIYIAFFLLMIFSFRLRGNIIAGFDYGSKYKGTQILPVVTNLFPETFVIGKNDKIYVYGKHLNLVKKLGVTLNTHNTTKFTFPDNNIIVKSSNRIVLGNFGSLHWTLPSILEFRNSIQPAFQAIVTGTAFAGYSNNINNRYYESITPPLAAIHNVGLQPQILAHEVVSSHMMPSEITHSGTLSGMIASEVLQFRETQAASAFGTANGVLLERSIKDIFLRRFSLPEGDYGLVVNDSTVQVESPQLITIFNPPPPVVPDIYPLGISWTGGITAINGHNASADILLGFAHPEQITAPFTVKLTSVPDDIAETITVPMSAITAASTNNLATVTSRSFKPSVAGNIFFNISADFGSTVTEKNEGNNTLQRSLLVKTYVYDVTVTYSSFVSTENMDDGDDDEYRIYCRTSVTNYSDWAFNVSEDGNPGETFAINKSQSYTNLRPGHLILLYTSGHEADSGFRDGDDGMGEFTKAIHISENTTQGNNAYEYNYVLIAQSYQVHVKCNFTRRVSN